jgi:hypothetical protein
MYSPTPLPHDLRADEGRPVRRRDHTGKPVLHIISQDRINRQLRWLWPSGGPISVPLCRGRSIIQSTAAGRRIAPEFTRDRARRAIKLTSDGSHSLTLRAQDGDLLTFGERKVAP